MIIENYSAFRAHANPGGAIGADGLTEFDPAKMRDGGFNGGFTLSSTTEFPIFISCNVSFPDSIAGIDDYDWFVSQRTSIVANKPFEVDRTDDLPTTYSGRIKIYPSDREIPDPFDISNIPVLFFAIDIYAIERLGGGIQRLDLMQYLLDANAQKTGIE